MISHSLCQLNKLFSRRCLVALFLMLFTFLLALVMPDWAYAEPAAITITGEGVAEPLTLTQEELQAMEQYEHIYSVINTWPTKRWYAAKGVKLRDLLAMSGIKEEATLIKFISSDGYEITLTVKELLKDKRYYFPGLQENHPTDGSIPGSAEGAEEVEPILALISAEGSNDPTAMNDRDAPLLVLGQRAVTEQTNQLFLKHVSQIQVLTTQAEKWDSPKANIPSGTVVPVGTEIELSNKNNDADKIYYTTDGTIPTINSSMFNWSASRWRDQRGDVKGVNETIKVEKDTVIKMITIGPGKEDSDVVTFKFTADMTGKAVDPTKVPGGPPTGVTLDKNSINLPIGSTFKLDANIEPFNATDQTLIWSSSDTRVATVDNHGLVTIVGPGTATITVSTAVGDHAAICVINGPDMEDSSKEITIAADISFNDDELLEPPAEVNQEQSKAEDLLDEPASRNLPEIPNELTIPEERARYLAEKQDLIDNLANDALQHPGNEVWQVFTSSDDTIPLPLEEATDPMGAFAGGAFLFLLGSGAGQKYRQYTKER